MTGGSIPAKADRLRAFIEAEAKRLGFDAVAVTRPNAIAQAPGRLAEFIAHGRHGTMEWMAETAARRCAPDVLWSEARSIIMLAMNYGPDTDPLALLEQKGHGAISVYARNRDYHDVMKGRLKELASKIGARAGGDVKVFVDTAPVMEKPLAGAAGLGWQGKHTNLVSRDFGSWLFLGSIFTTLDLPADAPQDDSCGSCHACLDACPTDAFPAPYQLDARRCISYLTIEHKGPIPREFRTPMGNRIYGCDDCLAVCPWNKFARSASEMKLMAREDLQQPALADLIRLDDAAFRQLFSGSPVKRIGRDRFIRNVAIAAGNSQDAALATECERLLGDQSPVVRGAAVWALSRLTPVRLPALGRRFVPGEDDADVLAEWQAAGIAMEEAHA